MLVAHAGATAFHTQFQKQVYALPGLSEKLPQLFNVGDGIDYHKKVELRVLQQAGDDRHIGAADQLVSHDHAAHTKMVSGLYLRRSRQGNAPCAMGKLLMKQRRAHGGFAMRCEFQPIGADKGFHPVKVVLHTSIAEHRYRQAYLLIQ